MICAVTKAVSMTRMLTLKYRSKARLTLVTPAEARSISAVNRPLLLFDRLKSAVETVLGLPCFSAGTLGLLL
ncbi:MAG: hypothetical protein ACD_47C00644G0003 [uncultured bacterium]|nr:MAG: hypothetical protein ACD_47C00644G0003 [uncultured bacterium]